MRIETAYKYGVSSSSTRSMEACASTSNTAFGRSAGQFSETLRQTSGASRSTAPPKPAASQPLSYTEPDKYTSTAATACSANALSSRGNASFSI